MVQEFQNITPEEGRQMIKAANVLLLPNWDIADALIFNSVSNNLGLQDPNKKEFLGTAFSNDQVALVMWSLRRGTRAISSQLDESRITGNIIVRRVADTSHVQAAHMNVDYSRFALATAEKEEREMVELQSKYEAVVEAYNKEVKRRMELENKLLGRSTKPRITYPRPPCEPFKSTPLVEIPDTPQRPEYYTAEDFEKEKDKLWALHVELEVKYEDKLRKSLTYLGDKIEWPLFYDQLARVINIWDEIKARDEVLKPIIDKWVKRRKEVTFLCFSVITTSCDHIERTFDIVSDLTDFDNQRVCLQRLIVGYLDKYKSQKFRLFPHALDNKNTLVSKDEWTKELNDLFCLRMNEVINENGHAWWAATTEEIVKAQIFFDSLKKDFISIDNKSEYVLKRQMDIL